MVTVTVMTEVMTMTMMMMILMLMLALMLMILMVVRVMLMITAVVIDDHSLPPHPTLKQNNVLLCGARKQKPALFRIPR